MSYLNRRDPKMRTHKQVEAAKKRPPATELQRLAQKENFALFQLAGMIGATHHLFACPSLASYCIEDTRLALKSMEKVIKNAQQLRKQQRKLK